MNLVLVKLIVLFVLLIVLMKLKLKLAPAMAITIAVSLVLYGFGLNGSLALLKNATFTWSTFSLVATVYAIFVIQGLLEKRGELKKAQENLSALFNNRRINATVAPVFIGLLPSAAAVNIAGEIVKDTVKDELPDDLLAFITTFFRHIPESILPTYLSIILMCNLANVSLASFVLLQIPMSALCFVLGYLIYARRIPKETGLPPCENRGKEALGILRHLWSLLLIIVLVLAFGRSVLFSSCVAIIALLAVHRFKPAELPGILKNACRWNVLCSTYLIMVFKEVLKASGAAEELPGALMKIPVPAFLIFMLLFFLAPFVVGSDATSAMFTVMAFSSIPGAGVPLAVLLQTTMYTAMQFSPTHICIHMVADYFQVPFGKVTRYMLPIAAIMLPAAAAYYLLLTAVL
jgi:integral membrane protein (TIGR00529 family)